jgi:hypothetical protein
MNYKQIIANWAQQAIDGSNEPIVAINDHVVVVRDDQVVSISFEPINRKNFLYKRDVLHIRVGDNIDRYGFRTDELNQKYVDFICKLVCK